MRIALVIALLATRPVPGTAVPFQPGTLVDCSRPCEIDYYIQDAHHKATLHVRSTEPVEIWETSNVQ